MAFIQVRNVDEELRAAAKRRSAALGVDLSTYVRGLIERDLARPTMRDWLDDVLAHPLSGPCFDTAEAVRTARDERDAALSRSVSAGSAPE